MMKNIIYAIISVALLIGICYYGMEIWNRMSPNPQIGDDELPSTDSIRPTGKLYVMGAQIEDYVVDRDTSGYSVFSTVHFRMMCKCYSAKFFVDLNKLEPRLHKDSINGETVTELAVPQLEVQYGEIPIKSKEYICDDDDYWDEEYKDHGNSLEKVVETRISQKFETKQNKEKALSKAKDNIRRIYMAMGQNVRFADE